MYNCAMTNLAVIVHCADIKRQMDLMALILLPLKDLF